MCWKVPVVPQSRLSIIRSGDPLDLDPLPENIMLRFSLVLAVSALPMVLPAQQTAGAPKYPGGWIVRADEPPKAELSKLTFDAMSRGWHVTTGPLHIIAYRPEDTAAGNFTATLDTYFFGPPGQYPEGYGIFIGGKDLAGPNQSYVYFMAANDGRFLLKKRTGSSTATIIDWKPSAAIKKVPAGDKNNVENVFKVEARSDSVRFFVNGVAVASQPRSAIAADGVVGFRINHSLSVHVAGLTVAKIK